MAAARPDAEVVRRHLEPSRRLGSTAALGSGRRHLDGHRPGAGHPLRGGCCANQVLRTRSRFPAGDPAHRPAGDHHGHFAALSLQHRGHPLLFLDHRAGPRDLLRGCGLQQRGGALSPDLRFADRSLDGLGRQRLSDLPLRRAAEHRNGASGRRDARLRAVLRRSDRHHLHRRATGHAADLDAGRTGAPAPAPGHQCRRHGRDPGDLPAHSRSLLSHP